MGARRGRGRAGGVDRPRRERCRDRAGLGAADFETSAEGQQALADSYALEYPLNPEASLPDEVKPFEELEPPVIDVASLNGPKVTELMTEAGLI